jgi:hypothetical protein
MIKRNNNNNNNNVGLSLHLVHISDYLCVIAVVIPSTLATSVIYTHVLAIPKDLHFTLYKYLFVYRIDALPH